MNDNKTSAAADAAAGDSDSAEADRPRLLVVTGLSGAGRTTALKILEDLGYEAVDNLPLMFLSGLAGDVAGAERALAVGIDSRTRDFTAFALSDRLDRVKAEAPFDVQLVFLDCADESLRRRFTETRRRHPLALDRPIADGIRQERQLLASLRDRADFVIDTTDFAVGDLRRVLRGHFALLVLLEAPEVTVAGVLAATGVISLSPTAISDGVGGIDDQIQNGLFEEISICLNDNVV
jgi:UPF0042 nucleotide-binding protein